LRSRDIGSRVTQAFLDIGTHVQPDIVGTRADLLQLAGEEAYRAQYLERLIRA